MTSHIIESGGKNISFVFNYAPGETEAKVVENNAVLETQSIIASPLSSSLSVNYLIRVTYFTITLHENWNYVVFISWSSISLDFFRYLEIALLLTLSITLPSFLSDMYCCRSPYIGGSAISWINFSHSDPFANPSYCSSYTYSYRIWLSIAKLLSKRIAATRDN